MGNYYTPNQDNNHLKSLIVAWRQDPEGPHTDLVEAFKKIIMTVFRKEGGLSAVRPYENNEELFLHYLNYCFIVAKRVNLNASNKEIYGYIVNSMRGFNKNTRKSEVKKRQNSQKILTHYQKVAITPVQSQQITDNVVYFNNSDMDSLSALLINGYTHLEARKELGWSNPKFQSVLGQIREHYTELGYGSR